MSETVITLDDYWRSFAAQVLQAAGYSEGEMKHAKVAFFAGAHCCVAVLQQGDAGGDSIEPSLQRFAQEVARSCRS